MIYAYSDNGTSFRAVDPSYVAVADEVLFNGIPSTAQIEAAFPGYAAAVAPTARQQAVLALATGLTIVSASLGLVAPGVVFACDDAAQNRISRMQSLIAASGGIFPAGLSSLLWVDAAGAPHALTTVAQFQALGDAIGTYALALEEIIATGAGTLPAASVTIA